MQWLVFQLQIMYNTIINLYYITPCKRQAFHAWFWRQVIPKDTIPVVLLKNSTIFIFLFFDFYYDWIMWWKPMNMFFSTFQIWIANSQANPTSKLSNMLWKEESLGWRQLNPKKSGQTRASRVMGNGWTWCYHPSFMTPLVHLFIQRVIRFEMTIK